MPLAKEEIDLIEAKFEAWLTKRLPEQKPSIYNLELRTRTLCLDRFMRWSFGLTLTVAGIIIAVLKFT